MNINTDLAEAPAATVRRFYDALLHGDLPRAASFLAPGVVLHVPGDNALAGDYHGAAGIARFAAATAALAASRIELVDVLAGNAFAAAYCRVTAERPGRAALDNHALHRVRLDSGRIAEIWLHNLDQHAVDAFWGRAA